MGSSPRVRGRRGGGSGADWSAGLIPACAGQTPATAPAPPSTWAHPRVCGADNIRDQASLDDAGSSPRVRGRPSSRGRKRPASWAHPRVCGADAIISREVLDDGGSSPRVRGRRVAAEPAAARQGLIPACAGQTPAMTSSPTMPPAHPRVCGADATVDKGREGVLGSSPRVRGRHLATSDVA